MLVNEYVRLGNEFVILGNKKEKRTREKKKEKIYFFTTKFSPTHTYIFNRKNKKILKLKIK